MQRMTLGRSPTTEDVFRSGTDFCRDRVSATSISGLLYRESHRLFPDEAFADLFADIGRASVPPRIVSVVMVLQRLEGLSDREAVDRITFDLRWKYAAGGLDFDYAGFVHTVLVDMRARLRRSGRTLAVDVTQAAKLVATVVGQDLEQRDDGMFRIARRVAKDRVISTVDPEARHGHKTAARGFDGYKGHIAIDPDSEIITATAVTAGNVGDGSVGPRLVEDVLGPAAADAVATDAVAADALAADAVAADIGEIKLAETLVDNVARPPVEAADDAAAGDAVDAADATAAAVTAATAGVVEATTLIVAYSAGATVAADADAVEAASIAINTTAVANAAAVTDDDAVATATVAADATAAADIGEIKLPETLVEVLAPVAAEATSSVEIYGDSSYGTAQFVDTIEGAGAEANVKVQPPSAPEGKFAKDAFDIDLNNNTVRCPAGIPGGDQVEHRRL